LKSNTGDFNGHRKASFFVKLSEDYSTVNQRLKITGSDQSDQKTEAV